MRGCRVGGSLTRLRLLRLPAHRVGRPRNDGRNRCRASRNSQPQTPNPKLLVTGGGAFNTFLLQQLSESLKPLGIEVIVPDDNLVQYKEALIMAFIGVLRWRQEYTVLSSVTGAQRDSIGGALWIGQEA